MLSTGLSYFPSYAVLLETLRVLQQGKIMRGDTQTYMVCVYRLAMKARTYFGLVSCEVLFEPCEAVAKMLQQKKASAVVALECVDVLRHHMNVQRKDARTSDKN